MMKQCVRDSAVTLGVEASGVSRGRDVEAKECNNGMKCQALPTRGRKEDSMGIGMGSMSMGSMDMGFSCGKLENFDFSWKT